MEFGWVGRPYIIGRCEDHAVESSHLINCETAQILILWQDYINTPGGNTVSEWCSLWLGETIRNVYELNLQYDMLGSSCLLWKMEWHAVKTYPLSEWKMSIPVS